MFKVNLRCFHYIFTILQNLYLVGMKRILFITVILLPYLASSQVTLEWANRIDDDFSFAQEWEYPESIYLNEWGQLSCDGICPTEIDRMKDSKGRIYDDSLRAFYAIIDTTHRYFSHKGNVRAYEFGETNYAFYEEHDGKIYLQTEMNAITHTSLHIEFDPDPTSKIPFKVYLTYNSIKNQKPITYLGTSGTIDISKQGIENGIIQMRFDLEFQHLSNDSEGTQTWEGKILLERQID